MINETAYALGANRSCIRELFEYGRMRSKTVGEDNVFDFSLGNPSIPPAPEVTEAMQDILRSEDPVKIHGYTTAVGDLAARSAIAEDLNARFGAAVTAQELFIGCGAAPELVAVMTALAVPGGELLGIAPYFPEYAPFAARAGLTFKAVPADVPDFQIRLDVLEKMLTQKTVAVLINSPNNPSGAVYTRKTLEGLALLLRKKSREFGHPIYLISDEPYRELAYEGVKVPFVPHIYENTVVCYSYSKSLSVPGERIGYVYVPKSAQDADRLYWAVAGAARACGHVCAPSFLQKVIARCAHLRPDLASYDKNRRALYEGLTAAGYEAVKPEGAFYLFVKAPGGDGAAFSEKAKQKDVLAVPGESFGCPGYVRLCYCVSYDKILRSLPLFRQLIEE